MSKEIISWETAKEMFEEFTVFVNNPEMRWFEKAWKGFIVNGLSFYSDEKEKYWILARIITLGIMYNEFCEKAWDEKCDQDTLILEFFYENEDMFNLVILGNMIDKKYLSEESDIEKSDSFGRSHTLSCL